MDGLKLPSALQRIIPMRIDETPEAAVHRNRALVREAFGAANIRLGGACSRSSHGIAAPQSPLSTVSNVVLMYAAWTDEWLIDDEDPLLPRSGAMTTGEILEAHCLCLRAVRPACRALGAFMTSVHSRSSRCTE